mgnify:CR=1 FL=1
MNYHNIVFEASYGLATQLPPSELPELVFAGRSNVGKSSLINKLFNRKQLARVSSVPGKTSTINFFRLEGLRFADLPGYGYAKVSKDEKLRWAQLIENYFNSGRDIRLVFSLMDLRHPPSAYDLDMVNFLIDSELPFVIICTKADKLSKKQQQEQLKVIRQSLPCSEQLTILPFSAVTGEGVEEIKAIIEELAQEQES